MDDRNTTPRAVMISAALHLVIVVFLFLAVLPCSSYESFFASLHLPVWLNPIRCSKPLDIPGPPMEAVLVGGARPPEKKTKVRSSSHRPLPPTAQPESAPIPRKVKVKTLPPPTPPAVKNQQRVVEQAARRAREQRIQAEKRRRHRAELEAQAVRRKAEMKKVNALFARMDAASRQTRHLSRKAREAMQQLAVLKSKNQKPSKLPLAQEQQSSSQSQKAVLLQRYAVAIQSAVTPNWLRPDNMPLVSCKVHIVQLPGGVVVSATVDANCPYDAAGRRSIENAVLRTQILPYRGFEKVFRRDITLTFTPK